MNTKYLKDSSLKTMLPHAYALSSTKEAFNEECAELRSIFSGLDSYRITEHETQVHRKLNNTGLLLHFHIHTDKRYFNSVYQHE